MAREDWFQSYCGDSHPTKFNAAAGRYHYAVMVDQFLSRFGTGMRLQAGRSLASGSPLLATRLEDRLPFGGDSDLEKLVTMVLNDFKSPDPERRWTALRDLADAYERVTSIAVPGHKKRSVEALIDRLAPNEQISSHLDDLLREMTNLSNDLTIRHHEIGTVEILHDEELVDFLFYSYFNLVRFALIRMCPSVGQPQDLQGRGGPSFRLGPAR